MKFTYGAELEIADFTRSLAEERVKQWGVLDRNDCTVCNSDGTVGNPYEGDKGGEIVTKVCESPEDLATHCSNIIGVLDKAVVNHSCWLHIHVGVGKDLSLDELKDIAIMTDIWCQHLIKNEDINPPKLRPDGTVDDKRNMTRLSTMSEIEYFSMLQSRTVEEFWSFFERKRHLINIRPIKSYGTIEYRFLPPTLEYNDFLSAAKMVGEITESIVSGRVVDLNLKNVYNGVHKVIDLELESKFRAHKPIYQPKVDNFTGEIWNG